MVPVTVATRDAAKPRKASYTSDLSETRRDCSAMLSQESSTLRIRVNSNLKAQRTCSENICTPTEHIVCILFHDVITQDIFAYYRINYMDFRVMNDDNL
jgi:hypothetical protein